MLRSLLPYEGDDNGRDHTSHLLKHIIEKSHKNYLSSYSIKRLNKFLLRVQRWSQVFDRQCFGKFPFLFIIMKIIINNFKVCGVNIGVKLLYELTP